MRWSSVLLIGVGLVTSCTGAPGPDTTPSTSIATDKGIVEGASDGRVRSFLGIPYAAPPVGALRFSPPREHDPWTSPIDANQFAAICPQLDVNDHARMAANTSEDCLYLNIWTPAANVEKAPVFVEFHGGGYFLGSGSDGLVDGTNLVEATGAIVVTINYRLGPLGFLTHPTFAAEQGVATAPSTGILDQREALAWVQRNIAAFGGDPARVTIIGQSAGGFSVCNHLAMPSSAGMFAQAVSESAGCTSRFTATKAAAEAQGQRLASALGCTDPSSVAACLRAKTAEQILNALPPRWGIFFGAGDLFLPVIDGDVLPSAPLDAYLAGAFAKVPVILGTTVNEGGVFAQLLPSTYSSSELRTNLATTYTSAQIDQLATLYPIDSQPRTAAADIITDGFFVCPTRRATRALAAAGASTYLYQFAYPKTVLGVVDGHGVDAFFVFRNNAFDVTLDDDDLAIADLVDGYLGRFAGTGIPNGGEAPMWPAYSSSSDASLTIAAPTTTTIGLKNNACNFWDTLPN